MDIKELIDTDAYDYVLDKGPITALEVGARPTDLVSISSLRLIGLRKGSAEFVGLPGHYVVNASMDGEELADLPVQMLEAPAVVHFQDPGVPSVMVIEWKYVNGNIYAISIPTDVWICSTDADKEGKWVSENDARPIKLEMLSAVQRLADKDGQPLAKNMDKWIKGHSPTFKSLNVNSLAEARAWCKFDRFVQHVPVMSERAQMLLRAEVGSALNIEGGAQSNKKKPAQKGVEPTLTEDQMVLYGKRLPVLLEAIKELMAHVQVLAVPFTERIIELDLVHFDAEKTTLEQFVKLSANCSTEKATQIAAFLKKADKLNVLTGRKSSIAFKVSPLKGGKPARVEEDEDEADDGEAQPEAVKEAEVTAPDGNRARNRKPVARFGEESEIPPQKKRDFGSTIGQLNFSTPSSEPATGGPKPKRPYVKSGRFCKDPLKAMQMLQEKKANANEKKANANANSNANGDVDRVKKWKQQVLSLQEENARLKADLSAIDSNNILRIEKKELETELRMKEKIDEAYERGYQMCKKQIEDLQMWQKNMMRMNV